MAGPPVYEPKPIVALGAQMGLYAAGVGLFVSAIQNALASHNKGALGVLTRTGGTIGFFALIGATFAAADAWTANTRKTDDALNSLAGGCVAGLAAGARARSIPYGLASCAVLGGLMGTFDATGSNLVGRWQTQTQEGFEDRRRQVFKQGPPQPLPLKST